MMGVTIAPVSRERAADFVGTMGTAFGFDIEDEAELSRFADLFEWDRSLGAFDGDQIVGTAGAFSLDMTVPGGTMACAGTTVIAVLPTHRRRGILRSMMDSHLEDVRLREEPIAGLWASDSAIYGRFGYGSVAESIEVEVSREHGRFHRLAPLPAPVRLISAEEAHRLLPPFYETFRLTTPSFFGRSQQWWNLRRFRDEPDNRHGATAYRYAVTEADGEPTGYVQYRFKESWDEGHGTGEVRVRELLGSDPASWAGLWRYVLDHDLTAKIVAPERSPRDPLFEMLEGRRRARRKVADSLWIRIMDVEKALQGRSYSGRADVIVEIHGPLDASSSVWHLDLSPEGAVVSPSTDPPEVTLDLEDLGACFMGWSRFADLAAAGRLSGDHQQLLALDRAFTWSPLPWCSEVF